MSALSIEGVTVRVRVRALLDGVSLQIHSGQTVALVGPNGSGKTTLLRCILGLCRPNEGRVRFSGRPLDELSARDRARAVALLAQHTTAEEAITVLEYVATARYRFDESRYQAEQAARLALRQVDAESFEGQLIGSLSGGERQRIALAALLAQEARVALLDEPANHLDPARQAQSYALLGAMQRQQTTMIIVTHDVNLLGYLHWPEQVRVVGLNDGKVAFDLTYGDPGLVEALTRLYGVPMHCVSSAGHRFILPSLDAVKESFE